MNELVLRSDRNGAATLTLNRPEKLNALSHRMFEELAGHVADIERQTDSVGLVILRGAGRCFSAGHDLKGKPAQEEMDATKFAALTIERLSRLPQPVISAVHGHCYTGALELALAADIVFAAEGAKFGDTHAKWGLTPLWGMSQRLPRRVGTYAAREMMFTARVVSGREALAIGLANVCVPDAEFESALDAYADTITGNSWFSHRANKRLVLETEGMTLAAGLAHEIYRNEGRAPDAPPRIDGFRNKTVKVG